jgi:hypothetical protein
MKVDINQLAEDELIDLHRRITERLRFLSQTRAHHKMLEFKVGDRVTFKPDDRPVLSGVLTKYNKKTVTVITDNGEYYLFGLCAGMPCNIPSALMSSSISGQWMPCPSPMIS